MDVITAVQAAEILGLKRRQVLNLVDRLGGTKLPGIRGAWLFGRDVVEQYARSRK